MIKGDPPAPSGKRGIRTIARWKSGLLPLEVFAMRVNWDTQRISPCMSLTFVFHMSPEGLENTFRDSLHHDGHSLTLATESIVNEMRTNNTHFLRETLDVRGVVICVWQDFFFFSHSITMRCMLMLKWHLPTPMPTSTINPREISDTISLFTEIERGIQPEH
jgi:hypothetical protein